MAEFHQPHLTPETSDIADILRRKRKARPQKACQPCRIRKVKCTYETPCHTCVERNHPELCAYEPLPKRVNSGPYSPTIGGGGVVAESWQPTRLEWEHTQQRLASLEQTVRTLQVENGHVNTKHEPVLIGTTDLTGEESGPIGLLRGLPTLDDAGETVYLGGSSVPAMVTALCNGRNEDVQEVLGKSILPVFGLDNDSATYPFVDLWGVPHGSAPRIELLCKLIPSDSDCHEKFGLYRDIAHTIYPAVANIVQFESDLTAFLTNRQNDYSSVQTGRPADQLVFGKDLHWMGLLFAVVASGFQCSAIGRKERQAKSQGRPIQRLFKNEPCTN
jgi:hypothetical protein